MLHHSPLVAGCLLLAMPVVLATEPSRAGASQQPLVGLSVPSTVAVIAPEQSGMIVSLPVAEGDRVDEGQVLFRLSSELEQLEVERLQALAESNLIELRARTSLDHARKQELRVRELRNRDISSDSDLQKHTYEVELAQLRLEQAVIEKAQAKNELDQARAKLAQRTLLSPTDGIVAKRFKSVGETVEMFVPVLEVIDLDPLWVEFECPVDEESMFRPGAEVTVAPAYDPADQRVGNVVYSSMKATASSHTFLVRVAVPNEESPWKAGLKMLIDRPAGLQQNPSAPGR